VIRAAEPVDAAGIAAIWNPAIRDTTVTFNPVEKSLAEIAELTTTSHAFLVWDEGTRILGFARYFQFRNGQGYARCAEHTILLHPDGQGRGIGRALMTAILAHAEAAGMGAMIAGVSGENAVGRSFHAAMGFTEQGTLPHVGWKFGRWIDLVLMQKMLSPSGLPKE
jgi:L-amino acid N-acyltransferase YncA